ncbi:hypothetical protein KP509_30G070800 [Ceratopteris richardii]|uniref:F-box domain-containing protein n=1 Tax=Ceratopteris richardii TaxID=49495 RepID=A0A8T2R3J2_CERRI|nr:hypothetical protein KP509_30G070800 [Ceratopteris richardii]
MDIPVPLLEQVLASLPLSSVLSVAAASKRLRDIVSSPSFCHLRRGSPAASSFWLFFIGFNRLLPDHNQGFAFDPLSSSWLPLKLSEPPHHNSASLSAAAGGCMVALAGARQTQVCIAPSLLKQEWHVLQQPMRVPRRSNPLVGVFYKDPERLRIGRVVVASGVDTDEEECEGVGRELAVEEYNADKEDWEICEPLPERLKGKSLVAALVGNRFYVADAEGGTICWMEGRRWREGEVVKPVEVKRWEWVSCQDLGLVAVAECDGRSVKIYKMVGVDSEEQRVKQVAEMPEEMCAMFEEEGDLVRVRSCAGGPSSVYVYSDSRFRGYGEGTYEVGAGCSIGDGGEETCQWFRLPPLPSKLHRFDRICCTSACVPLSSCISGISSAREEAE